MENELTLDGISKAIENMRSWCNHDEMFEEYTMGLPIERSYIFRCKCGKNRIWHPPKEQVDRLKQDIEFFHQKASKGKVNEIFGLKLVEAIPKDDDIRKV
jgi:hypothetical protein